MITSTSVIIKIGRENPDLTSTDRDSSSLLSELEGGFIGARILHSKSWKSWDPSKAKVDIV